MQISTKKGEGIGVAVKLWAESMVPKFENWIFDEPVSISACEDMNLEKLQKIMSKIIKAFVLNYDHWMHLMPLNEKSLRVFRAFQSRPYRIGSYRIDTVFDMDFQEKLIETTCRFPLNGYFIPAVAQAFTQRYLENYPEVMPVKDRLNGFYEHLSRLIGDQQRIVLIRNPEGKNASRFFIPVFENAGFEVVVIPLTELEARQQELEDAFLIVELAIKELESLSDEVLERMARANIVNDLRTVLLVHDKRFYDVLGQGEFRNTVLSAEEIKHLDRYYLPTYQYQKENLVWEKALANKNQWILKHRSLGKSEEIYAGFACSDEEWRALFERPDINQFIAQSWVSQPLFPGVVNGVKQNDYVTATHLFFDDNYFGPGIYRTSSYPVCNIHDDRKMFVLIKNY